MLAVLVEANELDAEDLLSSADTGVSLGRKKLGIVSMGMPALRGKQEARSLRHDRCSVPRELYNSY